MSRRGVPLHYVTNRFLITSVYTGSRENKFQQMRGVMGGCLFCNLPDERITNQCNCELGI